MIYVLVLALSISTLLCGQSLRISGGLADDQVLQRDSAGRAKFRVEGTARNAEGRAVEARVLHRHMTIEGFDWKAIRRVNAGRWNAEIAGIPAGGPYRMEFRSAQSDDSIAVKDVLVGDLWIMGRQSNMQGYGDLIDVEKPHGLVH